MRPTVPAQGELPAIARQGPADVVQVGRTDARNLGSRRVQPDVIGVHIGPGRRGRRLPAPQAAPIAGRQVDPLGLDGRGVDEIELDEGQGAAGRAGDAALRLRAGPPRRRIGRRLVDDGLGRLLDHLIGIVEPPGVHAQFQPVDRRPDCAQVQALGLLGFQVGSARGQGVDEDESTPVEHRRLRRLRPRLGIDRRRPEPLPPRRAQGQGVGDVPPDRGLGAEPALVALIGLVTPGQLRLDPVAQVEAGFGEGGQRFLIALEVRRHARRQQIAPVHQIAPVVTEAAAAILGAHGDIDRPAGPGQGLAAGRGVRRRQGRRAPQAGRADQAVDQGDAVRRPGPQIGAAERVEILAAPDAGRPRRGIAARPAQAIQRILHGAADGVGLVIGDMLTAAGRRQVPGPAIAEAPIQPGRQPPRAIVELGLRRAGLRPQQPTPEQDRLAKRIVGMRRRHSQRPRQDRQRRRLARNGVRRRPRPLQRQGHVAHRPPVVREQLRARLLRDQIEEVRIVQPAEGVRGRVQIGAAERRIAARRIGRKAIAAGSEIGARLAIAGDSRPGGAAIAFGLGEVPLVRAQGRTVEMRGRQRQVAAQQTEPAERLDHALFRPVGDGVFGADLRAVHAPPGDEVDHTRHRVRAVDRRGAVLDHLDPLKRDHRHQRVDVDEARAVRRHHGAVGPPLAVHQNQGRAEAEIAQVELGCARTLRLVQLIDLGLGARVGRDQPDQLRRIGDPGGGDDLAPDRLHRRDPVAGRDPRAGDHDVFHARSLLRLHGSCDHQPSDRSRRHQDFALCHVVVPAICGGLLSSASILRKCNFAGLQIDSPSCRVKVASDD